MTDFKTIRARAAKRKGGEAALASLLPPVPDRAVLAAVTDDRVLAEMAKRVFSAGFVWSVIEKKWPGFEEAFLGFVPQALTFQPDEFWHDLSRDSRIVKNPQKIKSVRENAAFVAAVARRARLLRQVPQRRGRPRTRSACSTFSASAARASAARPASISCASSAMTASSPRTTWWSAMRDAGVDDRRRSRPPRVTSGRSRRRSTTGRRRRSCRAPTSRASWRCRWARTIRWRNCRATWATSRRSGAHRDRPDVARIRYKHRLEPAEAS